MIISVAQWPVAMIDTIELTQYETVTFYDILANDSLYGWNPTTSITFDPVHGLSSINADQTLNYYPFTDFWGKDSLVYEICLDVCPEMCDRTMVYFNVKPYIWIPDIITPDRDGSNDAFVIVGINNYPDNELWIYSRWGQEVFHIADYQNDWYGTFKNEDLPDGTYYYVFVDRSNGNLIQKGYITIHR
jgi:gliding motility-associated-like protein